MRVIAGFILLIAAAAMLLAVAGPWSLPDPNSAQIRQPTPAPSGVQKALTEKKPATQGNTGTQRPIFPSAISTSPSNSSNAGALATRDNANALESQKTLGTKFPVEGNIQLSDSTATGTKAQEESWQIIRGREGFWRLGKDQLGIWWFISPLGQKEWLAGITTVQPFQLGRLSAGPHYVSSDWEGEVRAGATQPRHLVKRWAEATLIRIRSAGFNAMGAWCHPIFHELDVPISRDLELWKWAGGQAVRLYHPEWATYVDKAAENLTRELKNNPNLIGYYLDNELDWSPEVVGPNVYFDYLPATDPNRKQVLATIAEVWPTLDELNKAWNTQHTRWEEVEQWVTIPRYPTAAWAKLSSAFLERLATDYFRMTTESVRKYDPNHLLLGVRFRGYAPVEVVRASKNFTDAQSINYYVADALLDERMFRMMYEVSGQPIVIGEYAFHSLDGRSGNRNTFGFYGQVIDQRARADGYELFTTRLAKLPWVIGADWFQWSDEPPSGRSSDGEDVNFGIVDIDDRPYELMLEAVRRTVPNLAAVHANSDPTGYGVWREGMTTLPVFVAPHLTRNININGELSDWPADARMTGIRYSQAVGLERSPFPLPRVFMAWREDGLYLGAEVFDADVQGAPANGWWWTRDSLEFFISTQMPEPEQDYFDPSCHQFFFVPVESGEKGIFGVIGQWKRPGDALAESLIPHPQVQKAVRLLPDRYVLEAFIPRTALTGWSSEAPDEIAFNLHQRNWQHAISVFWSAPKEMLTQLRPGTWGRVILAKPGTQHPAE